MSRACSLYLCSTPLTNTHKIFPHTGIFVVAGKRTPFGAFGGSLKGMSATDLCVHATKAALAAGKVKPSAIDTVVVGSVQQTSQDAAYMARHVALKILHVASNAREQRKMFLTAA